MSSNPENANNSPAEHEHIPQTSADDYEYTDQRGIKIADSAWECPICGSNGKLMHRPGSKNTCANCFWVHEGKYNDYVLKDFKILFSDAQRLLADRGENWSGTPGDISNRLRDVFGSKQQVQKAHIELTNIDREYSPDTEGTPSQLSDF